MTIITLVFASVVGLACVILSAAPEQQPARLALNEQRLELQKDLRQQIRQHIGALRGDDAVAAEAAARALVAMTDTPPEVKNIRALSQGLMAELTHELSEGVGHPRDAVRGLCSQALAALNPGSPDLGERDLPDP